VHAALAALPKEWRLTLLLRHVEGIDGEDLAQLLGTSVEESQRVLERARGDLRQKLVAAGCVFAQADRRAGPDGVGVPHG
jgi:DNA-directed RNA polymerase specialized sigma24 family protein